MHRKIGFNEFFDQKPSIAFFIPGNYAAWWFGIILSFVIGILILNPMFAGFGWGVWPYILYWSLLPICLITHAVLIGSKEYKFLPKFHTPREYVTIYPKQVETKYALKPRIGSILTGGDRSHPRRIHASYDITDLVAPIQIKLQGHCAGGYLCENKGQQQIVFAYEFEGIPSTIEPAMAVDIAKQIESGFRDFNGFEQITLYYGSFAECNREMALLDQLEANAETEEAEFFLGWRRKRIRNLTKLKRHCPKVLRLFYTYTFDAPTDDSGAQRIEKIVDKVSSRLQALRIIGKKEPITTRLEGMMNQAFEFGYLFQSRFFKKVGYNVRPLSWEEAWETGWKRVNNTPVPDPNLVLHLDEQGFRMDWLNDSQIPNSSLLFSAGAPTFHKDAVYLPGKKAWVGGVVLNARPRLEWEPHERYEQMKYACEAILSEHSYDTELIVQFSSADQNQALRQAQGRTKDSNTSSNIALGKGRIDKGAEFNLEKSEDAESLLRRGATLVKTAWVANIYRTGRTTLEAKQNLNRAILSFTGESAFNGNIVGRESGYFDTLWTETLPFTMRSLLQGDLFSVTRFDRRITETTESTIAFMPMLCDRSKDKKGIVFIAKDSKTPLYYDPFGENPHGHAICSGFSGSGKTQLFQLLSEYAYCIGSKCCFFDADKGSGAGALEDFTEFVGGSYFKASEENSNLFEGTDWRTLPEGKEQAARAAYKSFLISSLKDLAIPPSDDQQTSRFAKDVLSILVNDFLCDDVMVDRYQAAWDGGLGSQSWGNIPCLPDFIDYATLDRLPDEMHTTEIEIILNRIKGSLMALTKRATGQAISQPSTFDRSARYIVFSLGATGDDDDNLPLILSAQGTMLFSALESDRTLIAQDECSRLFPKFPSIASNCADLYAMGRSLGIWAMLIGQDLDSIAASPEASSIFQNTATYLTGYIKDKTALDSMMARGIPEHLLRMNMRDDFFPDAREGSRRWLISQGNRHFHGDLYPSFASVGLTMNGSSEVIRDGRYLSREEVRREFFAQYPDKFQACSELAKDLENKSIDARVI